MTRIKPSGLYPSVDGAVMYMRTAGTRKCVPCGHGKGFSLHITSVGIN